jgi:hypothetical protein
VTGRRPQAAGRALVNQARKGRSRPSASIPGADITRRAPHASPVRHAVAPPRDKAEHALKVASQKDFRSRPQAAGRLFWAPGAARWAALPYSPEPAGRNRATVKLEMTIALGSRSSADAPAVPVQPASLFWAVRSLFAAHPAFRGQDAEEERRGPSCPKS